MQYFLILVLEIHSEFFVVLLWKHLVHSIADKKFSHMLMLPSGVSICQII